MGAWSHDAFGNDDAMDFVDGLSGPASWREVERSLNHALSASGYLEADSGSQAVAGAGLIAMSAGFVTELSDDGALLRRLGPPPAGLAALAGRTISRITGPQSELADLWTEGKEGAAWFDYMENLQDILVRIA